MKKRLPITGKCIALICAFLPILAHAADPSCPSDFSGTAAPYKLTNESLDEIEKLCNFSPASPAPEFVNQLLNTGPGFLAAFIQHCSSGRKSSVMEYFTINIFARQKAETFDAHWEALRRAKFDDSALAPELRQALKRNAISRFREVEVLLRLNAENDILLAHYIYNLVMAKPYLAAEAFKEATRTATSALTGQLQRYTMPHMAPPRVHQFAKQIIKRELGMPYQPLTDLTVGRQWNTLRVQVSSVDKPEGMAAYGTRGMYIYYPEEFPVPIEGRAGHIFHQGEQSWSLHGKKYEAKYSAELGADFDSFAPAIKSLDYKGMWADKKLTGMIMPDANMAGNQDGDALSVMGSYKEYFLEKGFKFAAPRPVDSGAGFLEEEVKSGRLDYMLKEAHSHGADDLVHLIGKGDIHTGTRSAGRGKQEVVHIFFPSEEGRQVTGSKRVRTDEFSEWMKERTQNGGKQLFYLDTSCSALNLVCHVAQAAQDKNLVVAAATDTVETFANESADAVTQMLDGIRAGQSFAEIRKKTASKGNSETVPFQTPGSKPWKEHMGSANHRSVKTEVKIYEDGTEIDFETMRNRE